MKKTILVSADRGETRVAVLEAKAKGSPSKVAELYVERRGTGPALLMISGGGGDAAYHTRVGDLLGDSYTVLTYDRRGNSRSTVDDPARPLTR